MRFLTSRFERPATRRVSDKFQDRPKKLAMGVGHVKEIWRWKTDGKVCAGVSWRTHRGALN